MFAALLNTVVNINELILTEENRELYKKIFCEHHLNF